jgi:hypothetical protein
MSNSDIINSIDYCDAVGIHRQFVIINKRDSVWNTPNIAFFRTTGSSNEETEWLKDTFYPTSGLTCKPYDFSKKICNYNDCDTKKMTYFKGHIAKMSDYTSLPSMRIYTFELFVFMKDLIDVLNSTSFILTDEFVNYPNYGIESINMLEKAFLDYFLTEEQLKLSYQLTPDNTGLWGFRLGNFSLSEFCRKRWGTLPKFHVPYTEQCTENTDEVYRFIVNNDANIEFDDMKSKILIIPEMIINTLALRTNLERFISKYKVARGGRQKTRKLKSKKNTKTTKAKKTKKTKAKKTKK